MFKGQPKGLYALALANTGERFGYYTMLAIFALFLQAKFGFSTAVASNIYGGFMACVYFLPILGGMLADRFGYGKMVTWGIIVMFLGYICLAIPAPNNGVGVAAMVGALFLIALGTGLFKGNLQVLVGNLYDDPRYEPKRDAAFSIFYMAINIGSMFAPTAATKITEHFMAKADLTYVSQIPQWAHQFLDGTIAPDALTQYTNLASQQGAWTGDLTQFSQYYIESLSGAYHWGFGVACLSLVLSMMIYVFGRRWFKHVDVNTKQAAVNGTTVKVEELSHDETKKRITALCLVFAVVIFFWMAFQQSGLTLTFFARDYTALDGITGPTRFGFSIMNLVLIVVAVYGAFAIFQSDKARNKVIAAVITVASLGTAYWLYSGMPEQMKLLPQTFQQFNPFFVVALTPVSLAVFGALAKRGKEPSAPRKIGIGMIVAALGYLVMVFASLGMPTPNELAQSGIDQNQLASPNWLISTYLVLTFAELFLSPMGISFVSKVAPPKYKGMMMGLWFAATAVGNYLMSVIGMLWGPLPLWVLWTILIAVCSIAAVFIFSMMKRLESVAK